MTGRWLPDEHPVRGALINWPQFWAAEHAEADWLLEPIIPRGRTGAIYAPAGKGKSLLVNYLTYRRATGQHVLDQAAGDPINVVYFDMEQTEDDVYDRFSDMGAGPDTDLTHLYYYLLPALPPLDTPQGGHVILSLAQEHKADLIVIDTTGRAVQGPENDADTIRAYYRHTGAPLKAAGFATLRIDHQGKNPERGQRGSSAKDDDVDYIWELKPRDGDTYRLTCKKTRVSWIPSQVDLVKLDTPNLRFELTNNTLLPGTLDLVARLDNIALPATASRREARDAMKLHHISAPNNLLGPALKYRREHTNDLPMPF